MSAIVFVPLTQGMVTVIDFEDFDLVRNFSWCARKSRGAFYAGRGIWNGGRTKFFRLSRLIARPSAGQEVDHRDGDTLNNLRSNLRVCSHQQNMWNQNTRRGSSAFKGVCWCKRHKKWLARTGNPRRHLGYFLSEQEAAVAYDIAAKQCFGEFAKLNFNS